MNVCMQHIDVVVSCLPRLGCSPFGSWRQREPHDIAFSDHQYPTSAEFREARPPLFRELHCPSSKMELSEDQDRNTHILPEFWLQMKALQSTVWLRWLDHSCRTLWNRMAVLIKGILGELEKWLRGQECLLCKSEDLSSNPQYSSKMLEVISYVTRGDL